MVCPGHSPTRMTDPPRRHTPRPRIARRGRTTPGSPPRRAARRIPGRGARLGGRSMPRRGEDLCCADLTPIPKARGLARPRDGDLPRSPPHAVDRPAPPARAAQRLRTREGHRGKPSTPPGVGARGRGECSALALRAEGHLQGTQCHASPRRPRQGITAPPRREDQTRPCRTANAVAAARLSTPSLL